MEVTDFPSLPPLSRYGQIVGEGTIRELEELADGLEGLRLKEVNSTRHGGGVAELLSSYIPFLRMLGVDVEWNIMKAETEFFKVTKTLHNFLKAEKVSPYP